MSEKVGRNDPCPCGSGKKYKQCCMLKQKESAAAKYTPTGKRKFKAKVLSLEGKSSSLFSQTGTGVPQQASGDALQRLKFRMTNKDFRTKTGEAVEELPFAIPKTEETFEKPEERERHLPESEAPFKPTTEDFREKQK